MSAESEFLKKYEIIRELGHGGMAKVYLARDTRLDRLVALKTLRAEALGEGGSGSEAEQIFLRVRREAKAIAKLSHHNIVRIYDVFLPDETPGGDSSVGRTIYLALEYIDGKTLDKAFDFHRREGLPEKQALEIGVTLADALAYAHDQGICHRDIKPNNIMREQKTGRMVLLDFSLAYNFVATKHTLTSQPIGTPAYMSPEQILAPTEVDHRTDVYSLGLVLYFMLAGVPPFQGDSYFKLCEMQINQAPEPLSKLRPGISPLVERAVNLAMVKRPGDRIQSARQLSDLLKGLIEIQEAKTRFGVELSKSQIDAFFETSTRKGVFEAPQHEAPPAPATPAPTMMPSGAPTAAAATPVAAGATIPFEGTAPIPDFAAASPTTAQEALRTAPGAPAAAEPATPLTPLTPLTPPGPVTPVTPLTPVPPTAAPPTAPVAGTAPAPQPPQAYRPTAAGTADGGARDPWAVARIEQSRRLAALLRKAVVAAVALAILVGLYLGLQKYREGRRQTANADGAGAKATPAVLTPAPQPPPMSPTPAAPTPAVPAPALGGPGIAPPVAPEPAPVAPAPPVAVDQPTIALQAALPAQLSWKEARSFKVAFQGAAKTGAIDHYEWQVNDGPWEKTASTNLTVAGLGKGDHLLRVVAVDAAGARSEPATHAFAVVNAAPTISWVAPAEDNINLRVPPTPQFQVKAEDADGIVAKYCFALNDPAKPREQFDGAFRLDDPIPGQHTLYAWVVDDAGDESARIERRFSCVPNTRPTAVLKGPSAPQPWRARKSIALEVSASDKESGIKQLELRVNDSPWRAVEQGTVNQAFDKPGPQKVEARAFDTDGLESETVSATFEILGGVPPTLTARLSKDSVSAGDPVDLVVSAQDASGGLVKVEYRMDGGDWSAMKSNSASLASLTMGDHAVEVVARDEEGRETNVTLKLVVKPKWAVVTDAGLNLEMMWVPGGTFKMGAGARGDEGAPHDVELDGFWLSKTEITVRQFRVFAKTTNYQTTLEKSGFRFRRSSWQNPGFGQADDDPVVFVDWNDAMAFCAWLSKTTGAKYSLPTEAQWEYACRAGTSTRWSFGDSEKLVGDYAWYDGNSDKRPQQVGKKKPNPWGLHDMHGNVWEWCLDRYAKDYLTAAPAKNPTGPEQGDKWVIRGGSWQFGARYTASIVRESESGARENLGFRVCRLP